MDFEGVSKKSNDDRNDHFYQIVINSNVFEIIQVLNAYLKIKHNLEIALKYQMLQIHTFSYFLCVFSFLAYFFPFSSVWQGLISFTFFFSSKSMCWHLYGM